MKTYAFPYTIERSSRALAGTGVSESLRFDATTEYFPWRGLMITLLLLAAWFAAALSSGWKWLEWGWIPLLILGCAVSFSESVHRRDRLVPEGLERRSGLLGRRVRLVPYESIELVTVDAQGSGRLDVGTVVVRAGGEIHRLVGIRAPHDVADLLNAERKARGARADRKGMI